MMRLMLLVALLISLWACTSRYRPPPQPKLPYPYWNVGLAAPRHMEVWVDSVEVLDQRGFSFLGLYSGRAGSTRKPEGWHKGGWATRQLNRVDLPERMFLRWQSLVEPQTYKIGIKIPQWVRDEMVRQEWVFCQGLREWREGYRDTIYFGMAPGGIVKVWVGGVCLGNKEVGRFQANIDPMGPYRTNRGYQPLRPEAQAYIDEHGIPYGTW